MASIARTEKQALRLYLNRLGGPLGGYAHTKSWLACCAALGLIMPIFRSNQTGDVPARLTLLAFNASMGYPDIAGTKWLVNGRTATPEHLLSFLVELPKPIACEATLDESVISVRVHTITDSADLRQWNEFQSAGYEGMTRAIEKMMGTTNSSVKVDVRWSDQSIIASLDELKEWFQDYRIDLLMRSIDEPDQAAVSSGANAIMHLASSGDIVFHIDGR